MRKVDLSIDRFKFYHVTDPDQVYTYIPFSFTSKACISWIDRKGNINAIEEDMVQVNSSLCRGIYKIIEIIS